MQKKNQEKNIVSSTSLASNCSLISAPFQYGVEAAIKALNDIYYPGHKEHEFCRDETTGALVYIRHPSGPAVV
jgi:hypothetical protein